MVGGIQRIKGEIQAVVLRQMIDIHQFRRRDHLAADDNTALGDDGTIAGDDLHPVRQVQGHFIGRFIVPAGGNGHDMAQFNEFFQRRQVFGGTSCGCLTGYRQDQSISVFLS